MELRSDDSASFSQGLRRSTKTASTNSPGVRALGLLGTAVGLELAHSFCLKFCARPARKAQPEQDPPATQK